MSLATPAQLRKLQRALYVTAKQEGMSQSLLNLRIE